MDRFLKGIGLAFLGSFLLVFFALLNGTFLFLVWPVAIPKVFPGLCAAGILAPKLSWWVAVCFSWICAALFKTSISSSKESK